MRRTGIANLPLHYGKPPEYLFNLMKKLAREICITIFENYGKEVFFQRISHPVWFQSFGCVLGFDWHSSGLTTTTLYALKEALREILDDYGVCIAGGKGKDGLKTPEEIKRTLEKTGISPYKLVYVSKITAKVDNIAVQDGYQIYMHFLLFDKKSNLWAVIQQGMNEKNSMARRYHWLSEDVKSFTMEPHRGICGSRENFVINLVAEENQRCQESCVELLKDKNEVIKTIKKIPSLNLPFHHQIFWKNVDKKRLENIFLRVSSMKIENFEHLIGVKGIGPKTVRAMALLSEIICGVPLSFNDPVRYSFAHGGKDGHPYPVDKRTYESSINLLIDVVRKSKISPNLKDKKLKKLSSFLTSA